MNPAETPLLFDTESVPAAFPNAPTTGEIAAFLEARLVTPAQETQSSLDTNDVPLIWPSHAARWEATVRRFVLALEWSPDLARRIAGQTGTALFLHRPFDLPPGDAPNLVAVFASHSGFDARLTTAHNPALARALGMAGAAPVRDALKNNAVVGMIGDAGDAPTGDDFIHRVLSVFGGTDAVELTAAQRGATVLRVAVMSALRPNLVGLVADAGAAVYVTGQLRQVARDALRERGVGVIAVGHRRSELWGLHQLGRELGSAFPGLAVSVHDTR